MADSFTQHITGLIRKNSAWLATDSSAHGQAMAMRWNVGSRPSQLLHDEAFTRLVYDSLVRWQAFRGGPRVSHESLVAAFHELNSATVDRLASVTILSFDLATDGPELLSLFRKLAELKPTATK